MKIDERNRVELTKRIRDDFECFALQRAGRTCSAAKRSNERERRATGWRVDGQGENDRAEDNHLLSAMS
jgi:hypothetical protein